jgi:hypothetical protein
MMSSPLGFRDLAVEEATGPTPTPFTLSPVGGSQTSLAKNDIPLSANYFPSKFSNTFLVGSGSRKRKIIQHDIDTILPKRGGGVEAFRSGEARIPEENDEDYDGVSSGWFGGKGASKVHTTLRWNKFKWTLFAANILVRYAYLGLLH